MTTPPFVVGEDGPAVLIPGRVARRLTPPLLAALRNARAEGQAIPDDVADAVAAIERAGRGYSSIAADRVGATSPSGSRHLPIEEVGGMQRPMDPMDTRATAALLGCTRRNVVDLIDRKALRARRQGRSWVVDPVDAAEYLEGRNR